jgi:hypothetical protein
MTHEEAFLADIMRYVLASSSQPSPHAFSSPHCNIPSSRPAFAARTSMSAFWQGLGESETLLAGASVKR